MGYKVAGQEGSSRVMLHAPRSAREGEGIGECSEKDCRGQNPMD